MKIFIMTDMEGISGIINSNQVLPDYSEYHSEGRKYLTADVNACILGCLLGGATEIVVRDAHMAGRNLLWHELSDKAEYIIGNTGYDRMPEIQSCDGLILLGYHAMAGTAKAVLEHTMSSRSWQNLWVNGKLFGEIGMDAAYAGHSNIPVIMVSGDDKACGEARELIPGIITAEVKRGLSLTGAKLLSQPKAHELIRAKACQAVKAINEIKPFKVSLPVTIRLELIERNGPPNNYDRPWMKVIDNRTFEITSDDYVNAFWRVCGI